MGAKELYQLGSGDEPDNSHPEVTHVSPLQRALEGQMAKSRRKPPVRESGIYVTHPGTEEDPAMKEQVEVFMESQRARTPEERKAAVQALQTDNRALYDALRARQTALKNQTKGHVAVAQEIGEKTSEVQGMIAGAMNEVADESGGKFRKTA